jgi:alkylation response protein AidB-like acyl-CoA dehydrogenase
VPFFQEPPSLDNQYTSDAALRSCLRCLLPADVLAELEPALVEMGDLSAGRLFALQQRHRGSEPVLTSWDAWGRRVDSIDVTPVWHEAARVAAELGVVATAYERRHGAYSRIHQFALAYLFDGSTEVYTCPLAMSDGAAKTLLLHGNRALIDRAVPRLTSRDPDRAWTSGQWMTERAGGSDVARSETIARADGAGWRLYGTKWFTSATTSQMALALARPDGNPAGGDGLALFYVEPRDEEGRPRGILVNRLKEKLGTRMVPTAELTLEGVPAIPVAGLAGGVKAIAPMLNVTRTWNAVTACSMMRRGLALAGDYAYKRSAFGAPLAQKPLHVDSLASLHAEFRGALLLAFRVVELLGREEAGTISDPERELLRALTPIAKLTTAKQAVAVASEVLESFGGAGYVEDSGLPRLLRDAQVLPIWEGTTNVLSLDVVRVFSRGDAFSTLEREVERLTEPAGGGGLAAVGEAALRATAHARAWLQGAAARGRTSTEAGARRFALTLGRALELALLVEHATWAESHGDRAPAAAARRLARNGLDLVSDEDPEEQQVDARLLCGVAEAEG